ncbi:MAG: hypothetical protein HY537_01920 [Deltaproteobacteria bacterium]|nr:hypothetical protein [Deltaproteobacteria bacterium]
MFKIFEWIGSIIAIAAIVQIASDPKGALDDIRRGPAPNLRAFSDNLMGGSHQRRHRPKDRSLINRHESSAAEKKISLR